MVSGFTRCGATFLLVSSAGMAAQGAMADVVINEVLGSTASADTEFVELYNRGTAELDISGWIIELWDSDVGSGFGLSDGQSPYVVPAGVVLMPQQHFLFANDAAATAFGVTADVVLPANAIENSSYTIVLRQSNGDIADSVFVVDADADDSANIAGELITADASVSSSGDFVPAGFTRSPDGADTLSLLEFEPIPAPSATPTASSQEPSHGDMPDGDALPNTSIMAIQAAAHQSPMSGNTVSTSGVVTATDRNGFYLQDLQGDADDTTSDALFVFTRSAPAVAVGNVVNVIGEVSEFTPGGAATNNLSTTQISSDSVEVTGTAALPEPVVIGLAGRQVPTENIDDDAFAAFEPQTDGIDFFESLEAMRVSVNSALVVGGLSRFGEIFTVTDLGAAATGISERATLNISPNDFNPEKVQIDENSDILPGFELPAVDVGAVIDKVVGVIAYDFGNFQIHPTEPFAATASPITPEMSTLMGDDSRLSIASYNVLNLDPNDDDGDADVANGRLVAIAEQVVNALNAPDIVGLQEIQDSDGSVDSADTSAAATLSALVNAILDAGGPAYEFIDSEGLIGGSVGGQPGGNIRVAFLYNPARVNNASATELLTDPVDQSSNPDNPFAGSRISLAAGFQFNGQLVTVVNNHLSSKGGSAPILGTLQPFDARQEDIMVNGSLDERQRQAGAVDAYVKNLLADDADASVVVLGDMNEFEFVSPVASILAGELTNLTDSLNPDERYSFIFQGNSQQLDHVLVSDALLENSQFDIVHVNSEFAELASRASDHDPLLATFVVGGDTGNLSIADFDQDGDVDVKDYRRFAGAFGTREGNRRYFAEADFDNNGRINRHDLATYLVEHRLDLSNHVRGDIDRDGDVDRRDWRLLIRAFGSRAGDRRYNPDADLDNNNRVNRRDLRLL